MRVAVVCPYAFDAHGGVQDQVARIVSWLGVAGHEAWAVAPGSGGPEGTRHVGGYVSVRANRSRAPVALNPKVARRVAAAVDDAEVVHIHEPFMPLVSLAAVFRAAPPKVGTFHADPGRVVRSLYRRAARPMRRIVSRLDAITAVSDVAAGAIRRFAEPAIVPNGIDLDAYSAAGDRVPGRVVFVGRDDRRKGLDVLLESWPAIARLHPGATLHVVGTTGEATDEGVEFLGRVTEAEKRDQLALAEVMVAPNRGGESFGIVVLEGLASGCAVVASDLEAFRAVAGDAAEYFPIEDSAGLADSVGGILGAPDVLKAMRSAGSARALRFGRDEVLSGYLAAYETAVAQA